MSYMNSPQVIVQVENLTKTYSKTNIKPVVSDISWSVHSGEILSLLGPNGAGKTTIVKMIAGRV
ncbi:MAG: ATP-binding cassette domain-containing protein [Chloroflexi bacterium]|nr:ATP-binding cassette domain-containing protein [Chloroflexota bacterium]